VELELQGEIDKFILASFAVPHSFTELFHKFFERFTWSEKLTPEQKIRYEEAHGLAKAFVCKHADLIQDKDSKQKLLHLLREFYRLNWEEKVSQATR
jgi:hypothetical protein